MKSGLLAAGTAFGGSVLSCGVEINLPCLGPALAPVPVPGMTYIRASEIGCALDCDLANGSTSRRAARLQTMGRASMQRWPARRRANPITLIIDGAALDLGIVSAGGRLLEYRRTGLWHRVLCQVGH